jgi:hypothetical protein
MQAAAVGGLELRPGAVMVPAKWAGPPAHGSWRLVDASGSADAVAGHSCFASDAACIMFLRDQHANFFFLSAARLFASSAFPPEKAQSR